MSSMLQDRVNSALEKYRKAQLAEAEAESVLFAARKSPWLAERYKIYPVRNLDILAEDELRAAKEKHRIACLCCASAHQTLTNARTALSKFLSGARFAKGPGRYSKRNSRKRRSV